MAHCKVNIPSILFFLFLSIGFKATAQPGRAGISHTYPHAFKEWADAFLAGNGKMGIMVFGNPLKETVIFNDRAFNLAKTRDRSFAQVSAADLKAIRDACAAGDFEAANRLAVSSAAYRGGGEGNRHPGFGMQINLPENGPISNYSRTCDFTTGEIIVKWSDNRGNWERKAFVSRHDNVVVQELKAPSKGKIDADIQLAIDTGMNFPKEMAFVATADPGFLTIRAKYPPNTGNGGYEGVVRVTVEGGKKEVKGSTLHITGASRVTLLTRTKKYESNGEQEWKKEILRRQLTALPEHYEQLLDGQRATHQAIYQRVKLDLHADPKDRALSNEDLLAKQKMTDSPVLALWERIFDAGRYHYLSSSSDQSPPDLLGIWTGDCNAGWGGYYHLDANLNLQVSGGNIGNMPEAMEGYFKLNEDWKRDFQTNALKLLGSRGLLAAGNTPGASTGLMANINDYYPYQYATGEEGWLLYPFWEHYLVTGDKTFLKERLYPLLKEMGHFYEDFLTHTDPQGHYIFAGSVSPENQPSNLKISLLNNSNFDISGAKFVLTALVESCRTLGLDQGTGEGFQTWTAILAKLPPYLVNEDGALQEWAWPGLKDTYNHRHSSQLLMVWPYREITPEKDRTLFNAAAETLHKKDAYNYENAGHGLLHAALIAANVNNSASVFAKLMRFAKEDFYYTSLGTSHYKNHGVFCTDVANTVPTIMMEMLVSSAPGVLELLPALPGNLRKGSISGILGRNRITVENLSWDLDSRTLTCNLRSAIDQDITLIQRNGIKTLETSARTTPSPYGAIARTVHLAKDKDILIKISMEK